MHKYRNESQWAPNEVLDSFVFFFFFHFLIGFFFLFETVEIHIDRDFKRFQRFSVVLYILFLYFIALLCSCACFANNMNFSYNFPFLPAWVMKFIKHISSARMWNYFANKQWNEVKRRRRKKAHLVQSSQTTLKRSSDSFFFSSSPNDDRLMENRFVHKTYDLCENSICSITQYSPNA